MAKFLVLYITQPGVIEEWMQKPAEERKSAEEKMQSAWRQWARAQKGAVLETAGAGKTKLVSLGGVSDTKNNVMMYSLVEAESLEAATKMFEGHPHLGIPGSTIEIMPANIISGMDDPM